MPITQSFVKYGVTFPDSIIDPVSFFASKGEGFMQVTFDRYANSDAVGKEALPDSFTTTIPLNEHALTLLNTLLSIIVDAAMSDNPPTGLENVKITP